MFNAENNINDTYNGVIISGDKLRQVRYLNNRALVVNQTPLVDTVIDYRSVREEPIYNETAIYTRTHAPRKITAQVFNDAPCRDPTDGQFQQIFEDNRIKHRIINSEKRCITTIPQKFNVVSGRPL